MTTLAATASLRIGGYAPEVGPHTGSFAQFEPEQETDKADELRAALAEEPDAPPTVVAAVEEFEESASGVTDRIEEANRLFRAAASGQVDPNLITAEIGSLLDLARRLDKNGRFEEELKLMRSLNGLVVLALRWLELLRSLRSMLESAETAGHQAAQAFAHHELGTLHLVAGEPEKAGEHLRKALRIEDEVGDVVGLVRDTPQSRLGRSGPSAPP